jgi:hypothetical protein
MNLGSRSEQMVHRGRVHSIGANDDTQLYLCQETAQILLSIVPIGGTGKLIVEMGEHHGDID